MAHRIVEDTNKAIYRKAGVEIDALDEKPTELWVRLMPDTVIPAIVAHVSAFFFDPDIDTPASEHIVYALAVTHTEEQGFWDIALWQGDIANSDPEAADVEARSKAMNLRIQMSAMGSLIEAFLVEAGIVPDVLKEYFGVNKEND